MAPLHSSLGNKSETPSQKEKVWKTLSLPSRERAHDGGRGGGSGNTTSTGEEERMWHLFQTCDGDGDGYISRFFMPETCYLTMQQHLRVDHKCTPREPSLRPPRLKNPISRKNLRGNLST